jgi:7-cyano-7-deazaguanine synthase
MVNDSALVLFSGGQDSTTCLAWALDRFAHVETIGFDYEQRHRIELDLRPQVLHALQRTFHDWAPKLGEDHVIDLTMLARISETALTREIELKIQANGLPNTFVPGRNLLFVTLAAAVAYRRGIKHLVIGVCETDYSGYPDCRDDAMKAMQLALNLGLDTRYVVHTPLMWVDKAATWRLAYDLGGDNLIDLIRDNTHTCYLGDHTTKHEWGYGCGACWACELRANGYATYVRRSFADGLQSKADAA